MDAKRIIIAAGFCALSGVLSVSAGWSADRSSPSQSARDAVERARERIDDLRGGSRTTRQAVDINTASLDELRNLPGVGRAHANRIIENRPYLRTDELLRKNIVPRETYDKFKNQIVAGRTAEAEAERVGRQNAAQKEASRERELRRRAAQREAAQREASRERELRRRAAQREAAQRKEARAKAGEERDLKDQATDALKSLMEKTENK